MQSGKTMEFDGSRQAASCFEKFNSAAAARVISAANPPRCIAPATAIPPARSGTRRPHGRALMASATTPACRPRRRAGIAAFLALWALGIHDIALCWRRQGAGGDRSTYVPDSRAVYEGIHGWSPGMRNCRRCSPRRLNGPFHPYPRWHPVQPFSRIDTCCLASAGHSCGRVSDFYPSRVQPELATLRAAFDRNGAGADQRQGISKQRRGTRESAVYRGRSVRWDDMNDLRFVAESSVGVSTGHWTILAFESAVQL